MSKYLKRPIITVASFLVLFGSAVIAISYSDKFKEPVQVDNQNNNFSDQDLRIIHSMLVVLNTNLEDVNKQVANNLDLSKQ